MMFLLTGLACSSAVPEGVAQFDAGKLDDAIHTWDGASEHHSGVIAYNLGVAYYRAGDLPRAIAELRGASRLRPRDANVQHNLALARSGLQGVPPPVTAPGWTLIVTAGELGLVALLITAVGSALVWGARARGAGAALLAGGLGLGAFAARASADEDQHPIGVVVDGEAVLRDAADINSGERLRLPPGAEVRVERSLGDFVLVQDGRGRRGWAPANAIVAAW